MSEVTRTSEVISALLRMARNGTVSPEEMALLEKAAELLEGRTVRRLRIAAVLTEVNWLLGIETEGLLP